MHKIRTVFQPDVEIEVGDSEYESLKHQRLIHEDPAPAQPTATPGAQPGTAAASTATSASTASTTASTKE